MDIILKKTYLYTALYITWEEKTWFILLYHHVIMHTTYFIFSFLITLCTYISTCEHTWSNSCRTEQYFKAKENMIYARTSAMIFLFGNEIYTWPCIAIKPVFDAYLYSLFSLQTLGFIFSQYIFFMIDGDLYSIVAWFILDFIPYIKIRLHCSPLTMFDVSWTFFWASLLICNICWRKASSSFCRQVTKCQKLGWCLVTRW
jgi:hypothetical protein